jgi:uncharacterized membrane protein YfcA
MLHPGANAMLFLAALAAGAVNAIAGGGTLITFPALLAAGLLPVAANATSTVALVPGSLASLWSYRRELGGAGPLLWALAVPSVIGGVIGALLVERAGDALFGRIVPWLILGATLLFVAQGWIRRRAAAAPSGDPSTGRRSRRSLAAICAYQLLVATYGGFFGAGMGILMLAALGFIGLDNIHRMNGLKNLAASCINGVAAVTFMIGGNVRWQQALVMAAGGMLGGLLGARLALRVGQLAVRRAVTATGLVMGLYLLLR